MFNYCMLIGKILSINLDKDSTILIDVKRDFKNKDGVYDSDHIPVYLYNPLAEMMKENFKVGDVIILKGRLFIDKIENKLKVLAEKIIFKGKDDDF